MVISKGLRAGLSSSGLDADVAIMAKHFGVSEQDFISQVVRDIQEGDTSEEAMSLQRISTRIEKMKQKPKLTLVKK